MGVTVKNLSPWATAPTTPPFTQWSDTFSDFNFPFWVARGDYQWLGATNQNLSVAANRFTFGGGTGGNQAAMAMPWLLSSIKNSNQFAQAVYAQDNGTGFNPKRPALGVLLNGAPSADNQAFGYYFVIRNELGDGVLMKGLGWNPAGLFLLMGLTPLPAIGDTIRIEVDLNGGNCLVSALINGAVVASGMDGGGLTVGLPGFGTFGDDSAITTFGFENFQCGAL